MTRVEEVADRERSALNSHRLRNTAPPTSSRGRTGSTDNVGYRYGIEHLGDFCDVYRRHVASWQALSTASAATGSDGSPDFRTLLSNMRREHFALSEKCVRRLVDLARVGFACFAHRLHGDAAAIATAGVANNGGDSELWRVLRAVRELNTLLASSGRWRHPQTLTLTELLNSLAAERCRYLCAVTYRLFAGQPELATVVDNKRVWSHCEPTRTTTTTTTTPATPRFESSPKPSSDTSDYQSDSSLTNHDDLLTSLACHSLSRQASHVIAIAQKEHLAICRLLEVI